VKDPRFEQPLECISRSSARTRRSQDPFNVGGIDDEDETDADGSRFVNNGSAMLGYRHVREMMNITVGVRLRKSCAGSPSHISLEQ